MVLFQSKQNYHDYKQLNVVINDRYSLHKISLIEVWLKRFKKGSLSNLSTKISDDEDSIAHGSIHDGVFEGVISYLNETYHLEPSHKYYDSPEKHSLIYRASDVDINPQ